MSDYKQTRDAAGKVITQYDKMLRNLDDDLVKQWDEYVESMGCVMGEAEHMAQQMRDCIEELESRLVKAVEALEWVKFGGGPNGESYYLNACATLAAVTRWIEGEDK